MVVVRLEHDTRIDHDTVWVHGGIVAISEGHIVKVRVAGVWVDATLRARVGGVFS